MTDEILSLLILFLVLALFVGIAVVFFGGFISFVIAIFKAAQRRSQAYADIKPDLPVANFSRASVSTPLSFQYDMAGARLRSIGPIGIRYNHPNSYLKLRPTGLGDRKLEYEKGRLARIGGLNVEYNRLSNRPIRLGHDRLSSDRFGNRLTAVGDIPIQYESYKTLLFAAGRPKFIGNIEILYNSLTVHPVHNYYIGGFPETAVGRYGDIALSERMIIIIFFVLYNYAVKIDRAKRD